MVTALPEEETAGLGGTLNRWNEQRGDVPNSKGTAKIQLQKVFQPLKPETDRGVCVLSKKVNCERQGMWEDAE